MAMALTTSLYLLWGMAHNLNDILIAQFKRAFDLTNLQAGLVQSAFYCAYLVMPIPVSIFMHRFGYRNSVIAGLTLYGIGALLFWPAAEVLQYGFFLGALFVIACGIVFLETSGMAIMSVLGSEKYLEWRINFASAFNPVGSICGIFIGQTFIFSDTELSASQRAALLPDQMAAYASAQAHAVVGPYMSIGAVVLFWALLVKFAPYPKAVDETKRDFNLFSGLSTLLASPRFSMGVLTQLAYVGTQIGCWSFLILYAGHALPGLSDKAAAGYLMGSLAAFMIGRFLATFLLRWFSNAQLCAVAAAANIGLCLVVVLVGGAAGLWSLVAVGFFMSVMFPAIYTMGLQGHRAHTPLGSALMIMSIIGGAIITALMGAVADKVSITAAYAIPLICFGIVCLYSCWSIGPRGSSPATSVI